jgi:hypothetical protein
MPPKQFINAIQNPKIWFEYSKKQRQVAEILLQSSLTSLSGDKKKLEADLDNFTTVFVNAHYHWGIAIENGFKAMIIKHQPSTVVYEINNNNIVVKKIGDRGGKNHDLLALAEVTGVLRPEYKLLKYQSDYVALKEVLKHLTDMIRWGARYPLPMNSNNIYKFKGDIPRPLVYGFHILDVMQPLFDAFEKEDV